jgi:methionine synthase II (cobalamin-independent)
MIKIKDLLKESKYSKLLYHGGDVDFNKPMYFTDSLIIAQSYGKVTGPYQITLNKFVTLDFSSAEGWWLPEDAAKNEVKKFKKVELLHLLQK